MHSTSKRPCDSFATALAAIVALILALSLSVRLNAVEPASAKPATRPAQPAQYPRTKLNVAPAALFAKHVPSPQLRALAAARYAAHRTLSREDMLDLFREVLKEKVVSTDTLNSLRAIVADGQALDMDDYVIDLTAKIVFGDEANQHYQGEAYTGNLQAGSSKDQFTRLVKKWFLGADRPAVEGKIRYEPVKGTLFNGIPRVADMAQANLGDCYFISSLGAIAVQDSQFIPGMFISNRDGDHDRPLLPRRPADLRHRRSLPAGRCESQYRVLRAGLRIGVRC